MSHEPEQPPEDRIVRIEGEPGESIFCRPLQFALTQITEGQLQRRVGETLTRMREVADDRLLVLLGALIVENGVDELLGALIPGYSDLRNRREFTFSTRIGLARALRLLPSRILTGADLIRRLRNDFVHDLSLDSFAGVEPRRLRSMRDRLTAFVPQVPGEESAIFTYLVLWTVVALGTYAEHVRLLNDFIRSDRFLRHLREFAGGSEALDPDPGRR